MTEKILKLHLGCGIVYRPGYTNIDLEEGAVADIKAGVLDLPFKPGTVDLIEANQLIEHFDLAHCRFALAHWYRLLRPGGRLVLETPDLKAAFKEFVKSKDNDRKPRLLSWIYGVQDSGMGHKTGFDWPLLEALLANAGFSGLKKAEPQTHRYEKGLRVECVKPKGVQASQELVAEFRGRLLKELDLENNSLELVPLERHVLEPLVEKLQGKETKDLVPLLARAAVCSPQLAQALLDTAAEEEFRALFSELKSPETLARLGKALDFLAEKEIHKRLFILWSKARKGDESFPLDLKNFLEEKQERMGDLLSRGLEQADLESELSYLLGQTPANISFFHGHTIQFRARTLLNQGIKAFSLADLNKARKLFEASEDLDPSVPLLHWNLARLETEKGGSPQKAKKHYKAAVKLARLRGERKLLGLLEEEARGEGARGPVSEFSQFEHPGKP